MDLNAAVQNAAAETGFTAFGQVPPDQLTYEKEVRAICESNGCRGYGATWACPPAVGTLEECQNRVSQFQHMLLFSRVYPLEDSFDLEGMQEGMQDFRKLVDLFQQRISPLVPRFLLLGNEGCGRCTRCTYPDAPCRFPQLLHHSLEGYGFIVSELAKMAGMRYINGSDTVTYFGALLY